MLNNCQFKQLDALVDCLTLNEDTYTLYISDLLVLSQFFDNEMFTFDEIENLFLGVWAEKMRQKKRSGEIKGNQSMTESSEGDSLRNQSESRSSLLERKINESGDSSKTFSQHSLNFKERAQNEVFPVQNGIITMRNPLVLEPKNEENKDGFEFWNKIQANPDSFQPFLKIGAFFIFLCIC